MKRPFLFPPRRQEDASKGEIAAVCRDRIWREKALAQADCLRCKVRYFSNGAVIGGKAFLTEMVAASRIRFSPKRKTGAWPMSGMAADSPISHVRHIVNHVRPIFLEVAVFLLITGDPGSGKGRSTHGRPFLLRSSDPYSRPPVRPPHFQRPSPPKQISSSSQRPVSTPQNEISETSADRFQIDMRYLMQQLPSLVSVDQKSRSWNEHGAKVTCELLSGTRPLCRVGGGLSGREVAIWSRAKALAYSVITSNRPEYSAIRKKLGDWRNRSTAALLSTLSLWMAGALGVSLTAMRPMLVTILYGVAEAGGDWQVLRESESGEDGGPDGVI